MGECIEDNMLSGLYGNLQSLISKKPEIELRLKNKPYDLLMFTEVWLDCNSKQREYFIYGYQGPVIDPAIRG